MLLVDVWSRESFTDDESEVRDLICHEDMANYPNRFIAKTTRPMRAKNTDIAQDIANTITTAWDLPLRSSGQNLTPSLLETHEANMDIGIHGKPTIV